MAKYLANSDDITIEEVTGTDSIQFQTKYSMDDLKNSIDNICVNTESTSTTNAYSADYINECNTYSENETFTGKYWIDGKKIYRKVLTGTTYSIGGISYYVDFSFDIEFLISASGYIERKSGDVPIPIGTIVWDTNKAVVTASRLEKLANNAGVRLLSTKDNTWTGYTVIIEYTKTTD